MWGVSGTIEHVPKGIIWNNCSQNMVKTYGQKLSE